MPTKTLSVPERDAAVVRGMRLDRDEVIVELRKVGPFHLAGRAVEGKEPAIRARIIENSVRDERH